MDTTSIKRRAFALPKMPNEFLYVTRWHLFSIALVATLLTSVVIASLKMYEVHYITTTTETEQAGIPKPRPAKTIHQSARRPDPTPSTTKPTPPPVVTTPAATYNPPPPVTPCQKANVMHPQGATLSNAG